MKRACWDAFESIFHVFIQICMYLCRLLKPNSIRVTIFKECVRIDSVQILYSIALQCVFPVLLFNPHTHDLVWTKTDYSIHVMVFRLRPLASLLRVGWVVVLGHLSHGLRGAEGQRLLPVSCRWCRGRQLPVARSLTGRERCACFLLFFPPEFRFIAITFSANAEAAPEENKHVHSVIEDLVQY